MTVSTSARILAVLSVLVGGAGVILSLLIAFGVNITPDQHTAIIAAASLLLLVVGAVLHPDIPVPKTNKEGP